MKLAAVRSNNFKGMSRRQIQREIDLALKELVITAFKEAEGRYSDYCAALDHDKKGLIAKIKGT